MTKEFGLLILAVSLELVSCYSYHYLTCDFDLKLLVGSSQEILNIDTRNLLGHNESFKSHYAPSRCRVTVKSLDRFKPIYWSYINYISGPCDEGYTPYLEILDSPQRPMRSPRCSIPTTYMRQTLGTKDIYLFLVYWPLFSHRQYLTADIVFYTDPWNGPVTSTIVPTPETSSGINFIPVILGSTAAIIFLIIIVTIIIACCCCCKKKTHHAGDVIARPQEGHQLNQPAGQTGSNYQYAPTVPSAPYLTMPHNYQPNMIPFQPQTHPYIEDQPTRETDTGAPPSYEYLAAQDPTFVQKDFS